MKKMKWCECDTRLFYEAVGWPEKERVVRTGDYKILERWETCQDRPIAETYACTCWRPPTAAC
jgi:hypothetical protein